MNDTTAKQSVAPYPAKLLILIALIQGLLLFWLRQSHLYEFSPASQPVAAHLILAVVLVVPTLILLALTDNNRKRLLPVSAVAGLITALIAGYVAAQLQPDNIPDDSILFIYYLTLALFTFKATIYSQVWSSGSAMSYRALFQYSWRNAILMALCLLFTLLFWGILALWAMLFDSIGVGFFEQLFKQEWFLYPMLSLAYGLAFAIFRKLVNILDTAAKVLQVLCQFLLPVLIIVSLLFLLTLPFVGLSALWQTGKGTALVLWLQVLVLFFVNAVYQDEQRDTPYWLPLHRLIYAGVALMPAYSLIAGYGLFLRVAQYGLTVERCWALLAWLVVSLFAFSYGWAIARQRDQWVSSFRITNVRIGLFFMVLMVAVNTPLLDFRKLSLNSQIDRLATGELTPEKLDVRYIARNLGRPGYLKLEQMKADNDEFFKDRVTAAYHRWQPRNKNVTKGEIQALIRTYPDGVEVPTELLDKIASQRRYGPQTTLILTPQDLNSDNISEWIEVETQQNWVNIRMWWQDTSQSEQPDWQFKTMNSRSINNIDAIHNIRRDLEAGSISVQPAKWQRLKIGDTEFQVYE